MHKGMPPLNALRAFEAAARYLSFTLAAGEMNVTPGALSHQIRGLEEFLGVRLFERHTRSIALTAEGKLLYPGVHAGFSLIRDAVTGLRGTDNERVLVVSTPPGLTSKWLAARLYRFADAHPDVEVRISSSFANVNFALDGVDAAVRNAPLLDSGDPLLYRDKLIDIVLAPVCSPKLLARFGKLDDPAALAQLPIIHDDALVGRVEIPTWADWQQAAGIKVGDLQRGLHFSSSDHALDAALEGGGVLLSHTVLAHDDLRSGRLVKPFELMLPTGRGYYFVCPKAKKTQRKLRLFQAWLHREVAQLDRAIIGAA